MCDLKSSPSRPQKGAAPGYAKREQRPPRMCVCVWLRTGGDSAPIINSPIGCDKFCQADNSILIVCQAGFQFLVFPVPLCLGLLVSSAASSDLRATGKRGSSLRSGFSMGGKTSTEVGSYFGACRRNRWRAEDPALGRSVWCCWLPKVVEFCWSSALLNIPVTSCPLEHSGSAMYCYRFDCVV